MERGVRACGELLSLGTMHVLPGHDLFGFWAEMLDAAAAKGARVDTSFYLYVLRGKGVDSAVLTAMEQFATADHGDPQAAIHQLLHATGLEPARQGDSGERLDIVFPVR